MEKLGWVGDDVWFAHAVHIDDDEIGTLRPDRLRRGALPVLEHAARLGHRPGLESIARPA